MASREFVYSASVRWDEGMRGTSSTEGKPDLYVAAPAAFGGPEGTLSPEDLIVASLNSCVMAAFLYHARRCGVELIRYRADAEGVMELGEGGFAFTSFTVRPSIAVAPGHLAAARESMERARKCPVSNSLRAEVRIEPEIGEAAV